MKRTIFTPVYSPFTSIEEVESLITENTKALFIETPTNPLMLEFDLDAFTTNLQRNTIYYLLLIIHFYTPYFQRPIEHGADIVLHSATKYIGGHNDVLAGLVVAKGTELCEKLALYP